MLSRMTPRYLSDWVCSIAVKLVVSGSDVKISVADVCISGGTGMPVQECGDDMVYWKLTTFFFLLVILLNLICHVDVHCGCAREGAGWGQVPVLVLVLVRVLEVFDYLTNCT